VSICAQCDITIPAARAGVSLLLLLVAGGGVAGAGDAAGTGPGAEPSLPPVFSIEEMMEAPPLPPRESEVVRQVFDRFPGENPEALMGYLREQFPEDLRRFKALALRDLSTASDYLTALVREAVDLLELKKRDPGGYVQRLKQRALEREAREVGDGARRSEGQERERLIARLNDLLEQAFVAKQQLMRAEVRQMEADLAELTRLLEEREKNRVQIIRRRIAELTGKADHLQW
jgi:hypothetical protein